MKLTMGPVLAVILCALCACTSGPLPERSMAFHQAPGGGELHVPVTSMAARRFLSVVKQQYDFSCGSAALATLLTYQYDDPQTEQSVFVGMWANGDRAQIRKAGFSLLDMKRYLQARGLDGDGYRVSLDQIEKTGISGIALTTTKNYRHFVVVKGVAGGMVLVGDPASGLRTVPAAEFVKIWNGVYFVIAASGLKGKFNANADWKLTAHSRYSLGADPLSIQALALIAPSYGEF